MRGNVKVWALAIGAAAVLCGLLTTVASASQSANSPATDVGGSGRTITVTLTNPGASGPPAAPGGGAAPRPGPPAGTRPGPATPTGAGVPAVRSCAGGATLIPCLPGAAAAPPPPPPPEPGAVIIAAARVTLQRELPDPQLVVEPGYAVTGLTAYLEIRTGDDLAFTFTGFKNAVFVTCRWTSFDVDWGDGSAVADVITAGGPYPTGDVTHVYGSAAVADDLHVSENWSCPWRDELGATGLVALQSDSHLPLEIREIQAVAD